MAAALGLIALAASAWVAVLRRRVQQQTEIIRERLKREAALKERYEDLFENANDMVFTHDLSGPDHFHQQDRRAAVAAKP